MRLPVRLVVLLALLGLSPWAQAHSPIEGIGNFYNGMLHPVLVPAHLISVLALGLVAGSQGLVAMRISIGTFSLALLLGLATDSGITEAGLEVVLLSLAAILSVLLVLEAKVPRWLIWIPSVLAGFFLGLDSVPEFQGRTADLLGRLGSWLGASMLLLCLMMLADSVSRPWQRIAIRIAGAWIGASALLVLSLGLTTSLGA